MVDRSSIRESSARQTKSSEHVSEARSSTGEPGMRNDDFDDDSSFIIEPDDILDLPRV